MLRTIRAFLWMRWRVSRNAFKTRQRDSMEQISRALGALAPIFLLLMLIPTVLILAGGGAYIGFKLGQAGTVLLWNRLAFVAIRVGLDDPNIIFAGIEIGIHISTFGISNDNKTTIFAQCNTLPIFKLRAPITFIPNFISVTINLNHPYI